MCYRRLWVLRLPMYYYRLLRSVLLGLLACLYRFVFLSILCLLISLSYLLSSLLIFLILFLLLLYLWCACECWDYLNSCILGVHLVFRQVYCAYLYVSCVGSLRVWGTYISFLVCMLYRVLRYLMPLYRLLMLRSFPISFKMIIFTYNK